MAQVLVVEDNPVNQRISSLMLRKLGFAVDLANNGEEGVAMWAEGNYDAIIMDCQMPVLDGYSATARIREQELAQGQGSSHRLPIIALTAHAMSHDRQKCLDSGMDDYLTKPVEASELGATLNRWLKRNSA
ncbi:MAG: response regulator [Acidobacteria bacterium]|nr:response regulator [Acidobacteriota bacterium]